jgi:hypothetical protein
MMARRIVRRWVVAGGTALGSALLVQCHPEPAIASEVFCGSEIATLNDNSSSDSGLAKGTGTVHFRYSEPKLCDRRQCKIEFISKTAEAENVIATIDLSDRMVTSYCVSGPKRIEAEPEVAKTGCPSSYISSSFSINLKETGGPVSTRIVTIEHLRRDDGGSASPSLDHCSGPDIPDGLLRWHVWTVPLADGSAALVGEEDFFTEHRLPPDVARLPYAITVVGAVEMSE